MIRLDFNLSILIGDVARKIKRTLKMCSYFLKDKKGDSLCRNVCILEEKQESKHKYFKNKLRFLAQDQNVGSTACLSLAYLVCLFVYMPHL